LIGTVFYDGLSKFDAPGSLWSPAKTSFGYCKIGELGLAFGLFMAGVCIVLTFHNALVNLDMLSSEPILPSLLWLGTWLSPTGSKKL
jgi:hypothetical protein